MPSSLSLSIPQSIYFLALFLSLYLLARAAVVDISRMHRGMYRLSWMDESLEKFCWFRHDEGRKTNELSRDGSRLILAFVDTRWPSSIER